MRYALILLTLLCTSTFAQALKTAQKDTVLMGSRFVFTAVHASEAIAWKSINQSMKEVIRIESLISSWDKNSETSKVNEAAGRNPVKVSEELYQLIARCKKISDLTNGYFDISFASLDKIWDFDKSYSELPSSDLIESSVENIDYQNIILDKENRTVFLKNKGMKIGFGAIGKGYAANRAKLIMTGLDINNGVVNAGGDLISWGTKPTGELWTVGIVDPFNKDVIKMWLDISDIAVVTSGNYEKFVEIDGEQYSHIINPKTGWPTKGISSVTILCPDAELADGLATSVFILGTTDGLKLVNHLNGIECLIINDQNEMFFSDNLKTNYVVHQEN